MTEYAYNDAGLVASVVLKDGAKTIASVTVAYDKNRHTNTFIWDGLALIQRGDEHFINEPHVGGGNPVASSKGTSYFNDALGTTVGAKSGNRYSAAALSAFGERLDKAGGASPAIRSLGEGWFTGKPQVAGLGHAFLMRNYRASLGKWQTADPLGYPDGWNQLAYCNNGVTGSVDLWGCLEGGPHEFSSKFVRWSVLDLPLLFFEVEISAKCSGDYENLVISYTIAQSENSKKDFYAPYYGGEEVEKVGDRNGHETVHKIVYSDDSAYYSNLTWNLKNLNDPQAKTDATNGQRTKTLSFDIELWCDVSSNCTYYKYNNMSGDWDESYTSRVTRKIRLTVDSVEFKCTHSKYKE